MTIDEVRSALVRRAISLQIGGFRSSSDLDTNWFGQVNLAAREESWPMNDGRPMHALCQLNLTTFPFRPDGLEDVEFLSVFIDPANLPDGSPNGSNWCLRAYSALADLVPLRQVATESQIRPFPMLPQVVESDYPAGEDVNIELPVEIEDVYEDHFETVDGFKVGGWPLLLQSEISWGPWDKHPADPRYVFQIDSTEKGNWMWGDSGVGYFGRGTAVGQKDTWACEWQCC